MFTFFKTTPQFLKLPVYGFDISDFSYKFLSLKELAGSMRVVGFGEGEIPPGVIQGGEVKEKDKLVQILRELVKKHRIKYVAISLPDEKGFVRHLQMPTATVKKSEIGNALALQLEDHVPLPPSEVVFDYSLLGEDKDHFDVVLRAMPKTIVESYCSVFKEAGATPLLVHPEMGAIVSAVVPKDFSDAGMIFDWGKSRTSFAMFTQRVVNFSATVPISGFNLTDAIAKQLKISFSDAEQMKKTQARALFDSDSVKSDEIMQSIIPIVTVLREEAEKYIQYWQTHSESSVRPKRIFLTGGDIFIPGLAEYLSKELGIPTAIGDSWTNADFPKKYIPELVWRDSVRFSCAIGLCLKAMQNDALI